MRQDQAVECLQELHWADHVLVVQALEADVLMVLCRSSVRRVGRFGAVRRTRP